MTVHLTFYDGAGCIGGNKILLEDGKASLFFDFGTNFKAEGLVVADFGPRSVERLLSFLDIAGNTGRRMVLTAKDIYLLEALKAAGEDGVPDPSTTSGSKTGLTTSALTFTGPWAGTGKNRAFTPAGISTARG